MGPRARTWLRRALWGSVGVGVLGIAASAWLYYGPLPLNWFLNRAFVKTVVDSPEMLSRLRIFEPLGIEFHQDELDDVSVAAGDRTIAKLRESQDGLRRFDRNALDPQQQLSYDMAEWVLERALANADRFRFHNYPVNQLFGIQNEFPSFMDSSHQIHDEGDAADYVQRLRKVETKFAQLMEGLEIRENKGVVPPTFVVDKVLEEMRGFVNTEPKQGILYTSLAEKLDKAKLPADVQAETLQDAERAISKQVYPAYRKLIEYFVALRPKSTHLAGVWKLPDGDAYYAAVLEFFTTTKLTADEIHAIGLGEVSRIQGEMKTILDAQGYNPELSVGAAMRRLGEEPRFLFADSDKGRKEVLATYTQIIDEVDKRLSSSFNIRPKAKVRVDRVPQFKEKTAPGAYYHPPPLDGSKPGTFYANLYDLKATPRFDMRTLAYHEAIPGHHFQIAIALEQDLPLIRRMAPFSAYTEGWALYAERLAWEVGLQRDPFDNLGRLQAELMRAVRLVVDTGLHKKRWTREQAISYMADNTGMAATDVEAEVERYIVMPGQACSYKVGMLEILRLREEAKAKLGARFDLRAFHDVVLRNGPLPLFLLERTVQEWVRGA